MRKKVVFLVLAMILVIGGLALLPLFSGTFCGVHTSGYQQTSDGKQIYTSIFCHQMSDPLYGSTDWVFPKEGSFASSTEYFQQLISKKVLDHWSTYHYELDVERYGKLPVVLRDTNPWCVVLDRKSDEYDIPFLISSNWNYPKAERIVVIQTGGGGNVFTPKEFEPIKARIDSGELKLICPQR